MKIAITNISTVIGDADVQRFAAACEISAKRDFCPAWGTADPQISFYAKGVAIPDDAWQIVICDNSDQAGALGYHETTKTGMPIGYAFAKTDVDYGSSWTVTASHELWEMLGDPWINTVVEIDHADGTIEFRPLEVSDAVEDDSQAYLVDVGDGKTPVLLSDFVTPQYFQSTAPAGAKYDLMGHVSAPLQLLSGGYTLSLVTGTGDGWRQVTARKITSKRSEMIEGGKEILPLSRRHRRMLADSKWQGSKV